MYLDGKPLEGLALFDQERQQIDAGWQWTMSQGSGDGGQGSGVRGQGSGDMKIDSLLMDFANAVYAFADLRYDLQRERIPRLEAQCAAARRQGDKADEGYALGNLGLAYRNLGEVRRAIEYYEQSLVVKREIGHTDAEKRTERLAGVRRKIADRRACTICQNPTFSQPGTK